MQKLYINSNTCLNQFIKLFKKLFINLKKNNSKALSNIKSNASLNPNWYISFKGVNKNQVNINCFLNGLNLDCGLVWFNHLIIIIILTEIYKKICKILNYLNVP